MSEQKEMTEALREMTGGSVEAFDLFYKRFAPLVMHIALRMLGDRMEAEDLCHDVFLEALRKGDRYKPAKGSLEAWLAVMTRSRCIDKLRKRQKWVVTELQEPDLAAGMSSERATPEEAALRELERQAVRDALAKLPESQRQAVATAYYEDKSQREMAEEWRVPLGTVKSWVRYGMNHMRRQLREHGWLGESGKESRYESR